MIYFNIPLYSWVYVKDVMHMVCNQQISLAGRIFFQFINEETISEAFCNLEGCRTVIVCTILILR